MKASKDVSTDLATLPELVAERDKLMPKIEGNTATVREARRFAMLHSLILLFENSKTACRQIRSKNGPIGKQVHQELIRANKNVTKSQQVETFGTPVLTESASLRM